jgi:branched-chain amino acid aminotransferase
MADRDGVIWFDGEMVAWREAKIHVLTHTLHYGMGCFEGVRAYHADQGTAIFALQAHTRRLMDSCKILGMELPYSEQQLIDAQIAAVRENKLESAYIRPMCFYGSEGMGLRADNLSVHCIVAAWEWGAYLGKEALENGEALLLDPEGYVAEGSGENIFVVRDGVVYTPEVTSALNGITRRTIFTLAADSGLEVVEKRITRDEIYIADEAFFTGTAAEVTPIRELDNRAIGKGSRGPITEQLQSAYFDLVHGRIEKHLDLLSFIK